jgi:(p)ppGpp synthase/HD superfamily hydrolase
MNDSEFERRAQTNIQLYAQLLAGGYGSDLILGIRDAYTLATRLFAGQLRPEGRPFVCHVVGVASILAMLDAPPTTIVAGLLHSAYSHGDFGYGRGQVTRGARSRLRGAVGPGIERLLACYSSHPWNSATVAGWVANAGAMASDQRQIAIIRLADTVEDALDSGLRMSEKGSNEHRQVPMEDVVDLAHVLGYPRLGVSLRHLLQVRDEPDFIALRDSHAGSYLVCPSSWREKMVPRFARFMHRVRIGA